MTSGRRLRVAVSFVLLSICGYLLVAPAHADRSPNGSNAVFDQVSQRLQPDPSDPCQTMPPLVEGQAASAQTTCLYFQPGSCDEPSLRDEFLTDPNSHDLVINTIIHVFCNNDGSGCVATQGLIDSQMAATNAGLAPWHVSLQYTISYHNNTDYVDYDQTERGEIRSAYFDDPVHQLNIFVVGGAEGIAEFPWSDSPTSNANVLISASNLASDWHWMTHEVGHALGLFHDWNFFADCGVFFECFELTNGSNGDTTGDFCSDTKPHPSGYSCATPTGNDCLDSAYQTVIDNYMSYGGVSGGNNEECRDKFTAQQGARIRCWLNSENVCWLDIEPGDVNCSNQIDISDAVYLINYVNYGSPAPCPLTNVGDFDCNVAIDIVDVYVIVDYIFNSGPHPECCAY